MKGACSKPPRWSRQERAPQPRRASASSKSSFETRKAAGSRARREEARLVDSAVHEDAGPCDLAPDDRPIDLRRLGQEAQGLVQVPGRERAVVPQGRRNPAEGD